MSLSTALLVAIAVPASAFDTTSVPDSLAAERNENDAVCAEIIALSIGNARVSGNNEAVTAMTGLLNYFVGRLKGRNPDVELNELVTLGSRERAKTNRAVEIDRCLEQLRLVEAEMRVLGSK